MLLRSWRIQTPGQPLVLDERKVDVQDDTVVVQVVGCAVCRNDLDHVANSGMRRPVQLPLGHEISGRIVQTGEGTQEWLGRLVVIPAQLLAGSDAPCPCCDEHKTPTQEASPSRSGLASHVITPTQGLCVIEPAELATSQLELADLAVLAEAVGTPYQAIVRSKLREGDISIFVGATGAAAFGLQIASALGAYVIALDSDDEILEEATRLGASYVLNVAGCAPQTIHAQLRNHAKAIGACSHGWKVYETTGTLQGQNLATALLTSEGLLSLIGSPVGEGVLRLQDLASHVGTAQGTCCCTAELLPEALELILAGDIEIESLIEHRPMSSVNETLMEMQAPSGRITQRRILIPDFD